MATSTLTIISNNPGIDGLLGDRQWRRGDPLDYGFPTIGAWTGYTSGEEPYLDYAPITAAQQAAVLRIFAQIESFTNLDFVPFSGAPEQATLRFGRTGETDGAHAYLPFNHPAAGDVWFSVNGDYNNPIIGNYADSTHLHEIGHALGLKHPHDDETFGVMPLQYDHMNYTVMTYRSYQGMAVEAPFHNATFGFNQTYMIYDIAALQYLYGADFGPESRNGDSYYVWTPNSGNMTINGVIELAPGGNIIFQTVWDGGGIDTYDFSAYSDALVVNLLPGEWSSLRFSQLADLGDGHRAMGNVANALLYQSDERSLIENAVGGSGNDRLDGNQAANMLTGNAGNDVIDGRSGADLMIGGAGDDQYFVDNSGDAIVEGADAGFDRAEVGAATYVLGDNVENLTGTSTAGGQNLTGNGSNNIIVANNLSGNVVSGAGGHDTISGGVAGDVISGDAGDDTINAYGGNDVIDGGAGNDRVSADIGDDQILGGEGDDRLFGEHGADTIDGGANDDLIHGGELGDTIRGGSGDDRIFADRPRPYDPIIQDYRAYEPDDSIGIDTLIGGAGADQIEGGAGTDNFIFLALSDSSAGSQDRILKFETGIDKVDLSALPSGSLSWVEQIDPVSGLYSVVSFATSAGTLVIRVDGTVAQSDFILPANPVITGTEGDDLLTGTDLADQIVGNGGHDLLRGLDGDDLLDGGAGNDRLEGGLGADAMTGGAGDDVFVVDNAGDSISEAAGGGLDTVESSISFTLGAELENLTLTGADAIAGTGNALANTMLGNGSANQLSGADGDDWIDGGLGADSMSGGLGNDLFFVDDSGDQAIELAGEGSDEVRTILAIYVLADNIEKLTGISAGGQSLTGNALDNIVTGGTGADRLDGGIGADQMIGGLGSDTYVVDNAGDTVVEAGGSDVDTVESSVSFLLGDNLERLTLTGSAAIDGAGNALGNVIQGNSGNNVLNGGVGADTMNGALGDDIYFVDDVGDSVTEASGAGNDEIRAALAAYSLGANIEKLTGTSNAGQTLNGNGSANIITAGSGNDVIDGKGGADAMAGGLGDDVYFVDEASDAVTELGGQGSDEIRTALAAYSLAAANVENLTGLSDAGQSLSGNDLANVIKGGWGADLIDGGLGADDLRGSLGNDVYLVDNGGDTVTEGEEQGLDEARTNLASFSIAGFANVENLTGGAADQTLTGNGFNNLIDGGAGADTMAGGGGHDVYIVDNLGDVVIEADGAGVDEVRTGLGSKAPPERAVYVLPNFVENLTGTSAGAQGVRDNALNNVISMGAGHDLVVADAGGVDTISGGGGNDFIYYGDKWTAADITNGGSGNDTISLIGNYGGGITFTATNLVGVERMALYSSLYLPGTGPNNYNVTMDDANVAAGTEFFVTAASLQSNEILSFNGSAETNGKFTVHGGAGNDNITGGTGSDFFLGNAGNDALNGMGGNDFLYGGLGSDQLTGGGGFDAFRYQSATHSTAASMDHILDFTDLDRIDLSAIDADGNAGNGNQAFTFIGSSAFGNVAGQLRAYQNGADWFVEGDTNGDGVADLVIQVTITDPMLLGLGASDFNL